MGAVATCCISRDQGGAPRRASLSYLFQADDDDDDFMSCCSAVECFQSLGDALQAFKLHGEEIVQAVALDNAQNLWASAHKFVECLLSGVQQHLNDVTVRAQIYGPEVNVENELSLGVQFSPTNFAGDFATRSRIPHSLRLDKLVRFTLQTGQDSDGTLLTLRVEGVLFDPLPDCLKFREHCEKLVGPGFNRKEAYELWVNDKDEICPVTSSKFRWIIDSMFLNTVIATATTTVEKHNIFWNVLHSSPVDLVALEFRNDPKNACNAKVSAVQKIPVDGAAAKLHVTSSTCLAETLSHRHTVAVAEVTATSSINFARFVGGQASGLDGANCAKLTKLISAAEWWAPAQSGWAQHDDMWQCVDKKNIFGRMEKEQGRVRWRTDD